MCTNEINCAQQSLRGRRSRGGWERARRIRSLRLEGLSHTQIAAACGCSVSLVGRVLRDQHYPIELDPIGF